MRLTVYLCFLASLALSSAWGFSPFYDVTRLGPIWWLVDSGWAAVLGFAGLAISVAAWTALTVHVQPKHS